MALPLSVKLQQDKKKKFEKKLADFLKKVPANFLKNELNRSFHSSTPPNASELIKIVSSAKFGGGNYWLAGATGAKLIISLVNNIWPKVQSSLDLIEPGEMGFVVLQPTFVGHLMHYLHIFPTLAGHLGTIDPDDYRHAKEISHFLFLEKETNSYGFLIIPYGTVVAQEAEHFMQMTNVWNPEKSWREIGFANWRPNQEFATGSLEHIAPFSFYFGTLEELVQHIPNRDELNVSGHFRTYRSGKVVPVRSHSKRKPIRAKAISDEITNHIVYKVFDQDGLMRYVGEGKPNRYEHVNSGASHNKKINEHYFLRGEMTVEIIEENLSKSEALAIEKLLINQSYDNDLWNQKGYELDHEISQKRFTESEVAEYVNDNRDSEN